MAKTYNPGRRLPNVPDMAAGVVKHEIRNSVVKVALQCHDCHIVEEPVVQLAGTIVCHRSAGDGKRRCKPCRVKYRAKYFPDCGCHLCEEDAQ